MAERGRVAEHTIEVSAWGPIMSYLGSGSPGSHVLDGDLELKSPELLELLELTDLRMWKGVLLLNIMARLTPRLS
jgi:hypothetical protein